ncbi:hypothetical protein ANOM_003880 [Aspergillus nomiae NRRL 13137]|uniref:Multiple drug resistance protein n=1 Tax=Aspergillus nomiae NRRL (strain ATCC 15546 / NRRL 13137 / CBS 260.88 / M93) TaxID=1509407 RepID=A0A0L1J7Y7_ASPN3|nr:uncharacterized protein ANOM_003880 [Aspergillus nomiae NRRL 13137]KNG87862.1 hypothetical protein ANOM_003880 [Aspergillus nomiae NRRL 13137]
MISEDYIHEAPRPQGVPYWRLLTDQGVVTPEIIDHPYHGSGTDDDPYIVEWIPDDPRNPMLLNKSLKWAYTITVAFATFGVSLSSSAYAGSIQEIIKDFGISEEVATLGVSLFVLGFAVGPLVWAPLSELIGRQILDVDHSALLRWLVRILATNNAGGVIADIFPAEERGLATSLFAGAPFLGPTLGPVIGGFLGENAGWRWVQGFLATFTGLIWIVESLLVPETYAPLLLRKRAARLTALTGKVHRSKLELERGKVTMTSAFGTALLRPWILLFAEPIVLLLSTYMAIIYGTLYMLFDAFPIVFQQLRGWSEGVGSLPFLGVMIGMMLAVALNMHDNNRYVAIHQSPPRLRAPEAASPDHARQPRHPIGLFCIIAAAPFGFGMVLVFLNIMSYLIDAYTIYAASVLAANSIIRSCFGAGFPLFTTYMYRNLGVHWASCIPAFLALACVPFPFVFYRYGAVIRRKCKYAAEADDFMRRLAEKTVSPEEEKVVDEEVREGSAGEGQNLERVESAGRSSLSTVRDGTPGYEANPYDIDRVNTRNSAISRRSRSRSAKGRKRGFLGL